MPRQLLFTHGVVNMGSLAENAVYFLVNHLVILFVLVPLGIIFLGYVIYIAVSVFCELRKNKKKKG